MIRLSTALRNFLNGGGSFKQAFTGGVLQIYSGSQPPTADSPVNGTLLCTISNGAAAWTPETPSVGSMTLTTGAAGSVDSVTINSIDILKGSVGFITSLSNTMVLIAAQINSNDNSPEWVASIPTPGAAVMHLTAPPGLGSSPNGLVVSASLTTITATYGNMASGVTSANGLTFTSSSGGTISMNGVWSGNILATATAAWFRLQGPWSDAGAQDSSLVYARLDGSILADMTISSTALVLGTILTINSFAITTPSQ